MPGEAMEDALDAAESLRQTGVPAVVTQLGENVTDEGEVAAVVAHYGTVIDRIAASPLDCHVSVKPTQLGLDLDRALCLDATARLVADAEARGNMLWLDMESSAYTDATIELFRALRRDSANVGLCLQANLRRTEQDLARLLPLSPSIRLVKGAYAEPHKFAWRRKRDVDAAYLRLAQQLLRDDVRSTDARIGIATHDETLIRRVAASATASGGQHDDFEIQLLYGIRTSLQQQLVREGLRVRILISYGEHWFPWYMRRLAERPANLWFAARSLLSR
jgi:proline dehydrogenase